MSKAHPMIVATPGQDPAGRVERDRTDARRADDRARQFDQAIGVDKPDTLTGSIIQTVESQTAAFGGEAPAPDHKADRRRGTRDPVVPRFPDDGAATFPIMDQPSVPVAKGDRTVVLTFQDRQAPRPLQVPEFGLFSRAEEAAMDAVRRNCVIAEDRVKAIAQGRKEPALLSVPDGDRALRVGDQYGAQIFGDCSIGRWT